METRSRLRRALDNPILFFRHANRPDELVTVPWLVFESGPRREIRVEESAAAESESVDEDVVADRLRDLGYAE